MGLDDQEIKVSDSSRRAAKAIFKRYKRWLGDPAHGNQDEDSCIGTIALIIQSFQNKRTIG
jgi:hypothetical protein